MKSGVPKWLKAAVAIFEFVKDLFGAVFVLGTIYLWYFKIITKDEAIFGFILLTAGGFLNSKIDLISLFKHIGNYKKGGNDDKSA
jgi:hypothetical protein